MNIRRMAGGYFVLMEGGTSEIVIEIKSTHVKTMVGSPWYLLVLRAAISAEFTVCPKVPMSHSSLKSCIKCGEWDSRG